jgi:hypothetical protein
MSQNDSASVKNTETPRPHDRRARIEEITAVGEVLSEEGLRLIAGGMMPTQTGCIVQDTLEF